MWVQIEKSCFWICGVFDAAEVESHVVFASCYAHILGKLKELLALSQILLLDAVYSKSDRYHDEYAEILVGQFFKLVQEDIAVETYIHFKVIHRVQLLSHVSKHHGDHLRTVPLTWCYVMEPSFSGDAVDAEGAITHDWTRRAVVHKEF